MFTCLLPIGGLNEVGRSICGNLILPTFTIKGNIARIRMPDLEDHTVTFPVTVYGRGEEIQEG